MHITRLRLQNMRRFEQLELEPSPGLNLITGGNGAGKTTILEAAHLLAYGRSFRGRVRDGLIRSGAAALEVFVRWDEAAAGRLERTRRAGLRHSGGSWEGRLDGEQVTQIGELCAALALVTYEPGSHTLVTGGGEGRRRYLDWGLFHVEPHFLREWRRFTRALKQRNALLKSGGGLRQLDAWDLELAESGETVSARRAAYVEALAPVFASLTAELVPAVGAARLDYSPGWRASEMSLHDALLVARERDLTAGYTTVGPHRADWRQAFDAVPGREALSRGQSKLVALSAVLAQAEHYAARSGHWPIVALDDLASELDRDHQRRVLSRLVDTGAQLLITGTERPAALAEINVPIRTFHVEHGQLTVA